MTTFVQSFPAQFGCHACCFDVGGGCKQFCQSGLGRYKLCSRRTKHKRLEKKQELRGEIEKLGKVKALVLV